MTTLTQFTAEIKSRLRNYASEIDETSIKTDVIDRLRKFGNNICELKEAKLEVKNSGVVLPEGFKSLRLAMKVDPMGCKIEGDRDNVTDSYIYRQRIENPAYFDEINQEYITSCNAKIITEKITINDTPVSFYYRPSWLSLKKGIAKSSLDVGCLNLHPTIRNSYPHEISITNGYMNTNFRDGEIYIQYNSLPTTEDGEIYIPEFSTGHILNYIETYVKARIAEEIIANNENPVGIVQLYESWMQQLLVLKLKASSEAKFANLGDYQRTLQIQNKRETSKFKLPILNFR